MCKDYQTWRREQYTCPHCHFCDDSTVAEIQEEISGLCRRRSPNPSWPEVYRDDWCREFKDV